MRTFFFFSVVGPSEFRIETCATRSGSIHQPGVSHLLTATKLAQHSLIALGTLLLLLLVVVVLVLLTGQGRLRQSGSIAGAMLLLLRVSVGAASGS